MALMGRLRNKNTPCAMVVIKYPCAGYIRIHQFKMPDVIRMNAFNLTDLVFRCKQDNGRMGCCNDLSADLLSVLSINL